jgi:short subunit dehydrogenase-like uncharacterized protein
VIQEIFITILFIGATGYVGRLIYRSFQAKHACSTGCGKCSVDNVSLEEQMANSAK